MNRECYELEPWGEEGEWIIAFAHGLDPTRFRREAFRLLCRDFGQRGWLSYDEVPEPVERWAVPDDAKAAEYGYRPGQWLRWVDEPAEGARPVTMVDMG